MIGWDESILVALYAIRTQSGVEFFSTLSHLGGTVMVIAVCISAAIILSRGRVWAHALGMIVALAGSVGAAHFLKFLLQYSRPDAVLHAIPINGYGFPSAHAAAAMALYGFLAWYVWEKSTRFRIPAALLAGLIIFLVGFSRLYLGVHFITDVVGGYLVGIIFVWVGVRATRKLERFEE